MKGNELVWRTLVDSALDGQPEWSNLDDLAHASGIPVSTAALALQKLNDIGATERRRRGGVTAVNPEKILLVLAAWRNLSRDTLAKTTIESVSPWLNDGATHFALGGSDAALTYINGALGRNTIASHPTRLLYLPETEDLVGLPQGSEVTILRMDVRAQLDWRGGVTSRAQTYADLFALPGWQAEEFRRALHRTLFPAAETVSRSIYA